MSSTQDASMDAGQTVSSEAEAAVAANNLDMEIEDPHPKETGLEYFPDQDLIDYNEYDPYEEDPVPALKKSTSGKEAVSPDDRETKKIALREKLAQNGFALRTMLMDEQIPAHYVSPMSTEDEMSVEDIRLEIPEEDLLSVASVQERMHIYAVAFCAEVYPSHTKSAQSTIRRQRREPPRRNRNSHAVLNF